MEVILREHVDNLGRRGDGKDQKRWDDQERSREMTNHSTVRLS